MNLPAIVAAISTLIPVAPNVHVVVAPCPSWQSQAASIAACAGFDGTVYVTPAGIASAPYDPTGFRMMIAHELIHEWDFTNMTDADHARWLALEHQTTWFFDGTENLANASPPGGERFADQGAICGLTHAQRREELWNKRNYTGTYAELIPRKLVAETCWYLHHHIRSEPLA
jgi:hypothetical protein